MKHFRALLLTAVGTPLLLMGDEVRRIQRGNNHAYCQDGDTSWFDGARWRRWLDTARPSPDDVRPWGEAPAVGEPGYRVGPRTVASLVRLRPRA